VRLHVYKLAQVMHLILAQCLQRSAALPAFAMLRLSNVCILAYKLTCAAQCGPWLS
jgi:hypothetical protein